MELKKHHYIIGFFFFVAIALRLYLAFQAQNFTGEEAYFNLRQIGAIKDTGLPLFQDDLSYGGRVFVFLPVFHYIIAFFSFIMPLGLAAKIIPNIIASFAVIGAYLVAAEATKNKNIGSFVAFICTFVPVYISETVNSVSVYSLVIPLTLFAIYFFMKIVDDKSYAKYFLITILLLGLTHVSAIVVVLSLIVYSILLRTEKIEQKRAEIEAVLFSAFFMLWLQLLLYRSAFLIHGVDVISQNIPKIILDNYFSEITILGAVYAIGVVPFVAGIYLIYKYLFKTKAQSVYLLMSFALVALVLLWLKLIQLNLGLIILGMMLAILFGQFMKIFMRYMASTKFADYRGWAIFIIAAIFVFTSVVPSINHGNIAAEKAYSGDEIDSFEWISENTPKNSIVLSSFGSGHLVTWISERKSAADTNFLFIKDIDKKAEDIETIFTTNLQTEAVELMKLYGIDYVYFSDREALEFGIEELRYVHQECFDNVYEKEDISIYKRVCSI